jgi:hypothetical protein
VSLLYARTALCLQVLVCVCVCLCVCVCVCVCLCVGACYHSGKYDTADRVFMHAHTYTVIYTHTYRGVEKDLDKAVRWFTKAASQSHPVAQYSLGQCYYYGRGVEVSTDLCVCVYDYPVVEYSLGQCYYYGGQHLLVCVCAFCFVQTAVGQC